MFQPSLLKSALAAVAFIEVAQAVPPIRTSLQDKLDYADFDAAMTAAGGFQWEAVPVLSNDGYNLVMFHLFADAAEVQLPNTKGPLMLQAGIFSDTMDWLERDDPAALPTALQLGVRGYDVWMTSSRGRQFSDTHVLWSKDDPATLQNYWNYSFEKIGLNDIEAFVDKIIEVRGADLCDKVTMVPHGTGFSEDLVAAARVAGIANKVGQITSLAPCLDINTSEFAVGTGEMPTMEAVYGRLSTLPIYPAGISDPVLEAFCDFDAANTFICNTIIKPALAKGYYKELSNYYY